MQWPRATLFLGVLFGLMAGRHRATTHRASQNQSPRNIEETQRNFDDFPNPNSTFKG